MWLMLQEDKPDDFVIATNKTQTVRKMVEVSFKEINIDIEYVRTKGMILNNVHVYSGTSLQ